MVERTADGRIRTTEWEDIQYKHGNKVGKYGTHEAQLLAQRVKDEHPDIFLKAYDANEEKVRDKLARGGFDVEGGDGAQPEDIAPDEDDDALAAFRKKRLAEMQAKAQSNVFGVVRHISGADYVKEITEGSAEHWVVAVMMAHGSESCDVLLHVMQQVASRRRDVKFVSLLAKEAVAKMPEKMLPCVVVYHKGQLVTQWTEIDVWKQGRDVSVDSVERVLSRVGVVKLEEEDSEEEDDFDRRVAMRTGDAIRRK